MLKVSRTSVDHAVDWDFDRPRSRHLIHPELPTPSEHCAPTAHVVANSVLTHSSVRDSLRTFFSSLMCWTCPASTTARLLSDLSANSSPSMMPFFLRTMVTYPKLPCPKKSFCEETGKRVGVRMCMTPQHFTGRLGFCGHANACNQYNFGREKIVAAGSRFPTALDALSH